MPSIFPLPAVPVVDETFRFLETAQNAALSTVIELPLSVIKYMSDPMTSWNNINVVRVQVIKNTPVDLSSSSYEYILADMTVNHRFKNNEAAVLLRPIQKVDRACNKKAAIEHTRRKRTN